jgi:hypothetical protein
MAKRQRVIELPENVSLPERIQQNQALLRTATAVTLYKLGGNSKRFSLSTG